MSSPTPWADRLFARFAALYGNQKLAATWPAEGAAEVRLAWEEQLRRFPADVLRNALQALVDCGREWPPTLPEFVGMCREYNRPEHTRAPAALPPPSPTEAAQASAAIDRIAAGMAKPPAWDHLDWAKRPRSLQAVVLVQRGAEREPRLRDILRDLVATEGRACLSDEARAAVQAIGREVVA